MSKDIWHKPTEPADPDNQLIIYDWIEHTNELGWFDDEDKVFRKYTNDEIYTEESLMRWCDVDELIDDYNRTRKALDVAKSKLNGIHRLYSKAFYTREDWLQVCMEMVDKANTALEQITALEQKDK